MAASTALSTAANPTQVRELLLPLLFPWLL
jgi:hypothetical protein